MSAAPGAEAGGESPRHSTTQSPERGRRNAAQSPREDRASARAARNNEDEDSVLQALLDMPWRGQAEKLKPTQKKLLSHFEERGIRKTVLANDGSGTSATAVTKYWVRYDGEDTADEMTRLNITRMFKKLLNSKRCPDCTWQLCSLFGIKLRRVRARSLLEN